MNFEVIVNSVQESPVHYGERLVILAGTGGSSADAPTDLKKAGLAGADGTDKPEIVKKPTAMVEKDSTFATETNNCVDELLIEEAANTTADTETVDDDDDDSAERSTKTLGEEAARPTGGSAVVSPEQPPVPTAPTASEKVRDDEEANQAFQTPKRKKLAIPAAFQTGTSTISLTPVKKATVARLWGTVDESNRFESATTPRVSNKSSHGQATSPVSPNKTAKRSNKSKKARRAKWKLMTEIAKLDVQIEEAKKQHAVKEEAIPIVKQEVVEENEQAAPQDDHDDDTNHSFGQVSEQVENEGAVVTEATASKEDETADVLEIESIAGSGSSHYEDALGGFLESIDGSCSSRYEDALGGFLQQHQHSFNNDRSALNDDPSDKRSDDAVDMTGQVEGSESLGEAVELSKCRTTDYDTICHVLLSKGCVTDEDDNIELKDPSASSDNASSAATGETEASTNEFSVEESTKDKPTAAEQLDDGEEEESENRKKIVVVRQKPQRRKSFGDKLRNSFRLKKKKRATSADADDTQEQEDCEPPASGAQLIKAEELPKDIQDALANGEKKIIVVRKVKRRKSLGEKLRRSFRLKKEEKVEGLSADPDQYVYVNMRGNYQRVLFDCGTGP